MKRKKSKLPEEYLRLGQYLWERVNQSDPNDKGAQDTLAQVSYPLIEAYDDGGFMWELETWAADRRDSGGFDWQESGDYLREHWPHFFEFNSNEHDLAKSNMSAKKSKLPKEYLLLGRYLWERVNESDPKDKETQDVLSEITYRLIDAYDDDGFMWELKAWAAARRDTGEAWQETADSFKESWPHFFEESKQTKTPQ